MPTGSGAIVVHRALEGALPNYSVTPYSPKLTYLPPLLNALVSVPESDLIHTTPDYAMFFKRPKVPLVSTFHNLVIDAFMRPYSTFLQRVHYQTDLKYFLRRAIEVSSALTAVSQFTADLARSELGIDCEIAVIPNGCDTQHFRPSTKPNTGRTIRALFPANPSRRKGAHWLPGISARLDDDITIACATGLRGGQTDALSVSGIEILGRVPYSDMPALYQSMDVVILPTVREGDSLVVLEAMSCGLPIIASDCSSLAERVIHERGGFLCKIGDVAAFSDALHVLRDPDLRRRMGEFNRRRAESEFALSVMTGRYADMFANLAARD